MLSRSLRLREPGMAVLAYPPKGKYGSLRYFHWDLRPESFDEGSGIEYNESASESMEIR
jgi:hypothetical protein